MKLAIDFYSKEEVSISIDISTNPQFGLQECNDLFLFSCLALRQLSNLRNHPVGVTSAILLSDFSERTTGEIIEGGFSFPNKLELKYLFIKYGVKFEPIHQTICDEIMTGIPNLVDFRGQGKKGFYLSTPKLIMDLKGFGILGLQVNFYAFQSLFSFYKYLAMMNRTDSIFKDYLQKIASEAGELYLKNRIQSDQADLSLRIMQILGIYSYDKNRVPIACPTIIS
jgi:hypothetical protein